MKKPLIVITGIALVACEPNSTPLEPAYDYTPAPTPEASRSVEIPATVPTIAVVKPPASAPTYFDSIEIRPEWGARLDKIIAGMIRDKDRYQGVQNMRQNGVPWHITGGIHERESSRNFTRHLHEGSPLIHRTRYIPKGRPPLPKNPPFTWEESAEDAFYILKHEDRVDWNDTSKALDAIEQYNGTGYRRYHPEVKTPYLYSGTTLYERGKYVADGRFDGLAVDKQPGVAALWKRMIERGLL